MKPIPVVFHIGPLQVHTYGVGLAVTFWFALEYMRRRLKARQLPDEWLSGAFLWVIGAAIVGARLVHVVANLSFYTSEPSQIPLIWHGGLSSFGGLLFGVPTGIWFQRRYCPQLGTWRALDIAAPVLMASWAVGRLLGPQLMIRGGGRPTTAWYGLSYAGQVGHRIPVPLFQAAECTVIWAALVLLDRRTDDPDRTPGVVLAGMAALWGLARFGDEYLWLAVPRLWDAVEVTGLILAAGGSAGLALLLRRGARRRSGGVARAPASDPVVAG